MAEVAVMPAQHLVIRRLLTGSGLRFFQLFISAGIGLFMTPFMIGRLGDDLYGLWILAGSFSAAYGLLDLGLSAATGRFVAVALGKGDFEEANRYVNTSLVIYSFMGGCVVIAAAALASIASVFVEMPEHASLLGILIVIIGAELGISFPLRALMGTVSAKMRYDVTAAFGIGFRLLSTAGIVLLLLMGRGLIPLALFAFFVGICRIPIWYFTVRRISPEIKVAPRMASRKVAAGLFSFSIFAFISQMADLLRFKIDNFVIAAFLGPGDVTHYTIAATLTHYLMLSTVAIMGVLGVLFAQQHGRGAQEEMRRTLNFGIRAATSIVSFMGFGLIAWGHPFIQLWVGAEYLDAYPSLVVIVIGLMVALWQTSTIGVLYGKAKHQYFALSNGLEAVANVVCSIIFIQYWGILGVAMGTCIPMIVIKLTLQPMLLTKALNISISLYFKWLLKAVLYVLISLIIPAIITYYFVGSNYSDLLLTGVLCLFSYFAVIGILNFSREERQKVWKAVIK